MKHADFVHLHNHSEYSLLDGANRIKDLVAAARAHQMPALALTDHGAMHGAIEFYKEAHSQGVKPILGCEVYITTGSRHDRTPANAGGPTTHHLVLLAKNEAGYRNLMKLTSAAFLEGFYYRPRIDKELLSRYSEGLVALTACLKGEVPSLLLEEKEERALEALGLYQDVLPKEDVYLEIQDHEIDEERRVIPLLRRLAARTGTKIVATNDCHYMRGDDAESHDILICIGTGKEYDDPKRLRMSTTHLYFKSPQEMLALFREIPEACTNTIEVAEKCNLELRLGQSKVPVFPLPPEYTSEDEYLAGLSKQGLEKRYPGRSPEMMDRLEYELRVIREMGFSGYFLITHDFIRAAKERGIPVGPGRGSAAGSLVSYCLGITDVDPIRYDLLFERFLNPERISMPDIDIDFCFERRGEIIEYVVQKYGKESVSQIITFGRMASRAALRDVGRVLKVPFGEMDRIAKMIPADPGMTLEKAFQQNPELGRLEGTDPAFHRVLSHARRLEGLARHASTHAAGVVVAPGDLTDYVPLFKSNRDEITTQYDMKSVEEVGLLKMDFLGLRTLTVIHRALEMVSAKLGQVMTPEQIPYEDPKVYELLSSGDTIGVFQFESSGMRSMLKNLRPTTFEDVMACTALYRPGPLGAGMDKEFIDRKHGRKKIEVLHPAMEEVLRDTYGVILYQDQVMAIAAAMAGFSLGQADILRRAMGKKKPEEMDRQRAKFLEGCKKRRIAEGVAGQVFDLMAYFAGYGFNKSHSAAYAVLSIQTAWLKAHHPSEFLAATLTSEMGDSKRVPVLIEDARRLQIPLDPPDLNRSQAVFTVSEGRIVFGLAAVKNVGLGAIEKILEVRREGGAFTTLYDFVTRIDLKTVNRRVLESLAQAGAFDGLGRHRAEIFAAVPLLLEAGARVRLEKERGQTSLFDATPDEETLNPFRTGLPSTEPWPESQKLALEKEVLGFYFSGHPLSKWALEIKSFGNTRTSELGELSDGTPVVLGCLVIKVRGAFDRRGNRMGFVELEDFTGTVEAIAFSDPFQQFGDCLAVDSMVLVAGTISLKDEADPKLMFEKAIPLDQVAEKLADRLLLDVEDSDVTDEFVNRLKDISRRRIGPLRTVLRVGLRDGNVVQVELESIRFPGDRETLAELAELVGEEAIRYGGTWAASPSDRRGGRRGEFRRAPQPSGAR